MSYDPNASYYGYQPQASYYTPPANPTHPPAATHPPPSNLHASFYGGGSYYAPAAPATPSPLPPQGSYYSPTPYATGSTYDPSAAYNGVSTGYNPAGSNAYGTGAANPYSSPAPGTYGATGGAYNSSPAPSVPHSDSGLPLPNFGAMSYHSPSPASAYPSAPPAAAPGAYNSPNPAGSAASQLPLPPASPVAPSAGSSWVEEEKKRVEEEMRRLTLGARPYESSAYGTPTSSGAGGSMPPPQPTAPYVDPKAEEERIRREVEAKVRSEEQGRLREMEMKLDAERRAREEAEQRSRQEEEERRRVEAMRMQEAASAREAQMAAQRAEELRQQEAKMRQENEEMRRKMEADYEAKMRQLEQERIQREAQLQEEAKRARVQAEQKLMETFARRQQTEEDKRRREESERRAREEREVERLRAEAEELRRRHEEEVARAVTALQRSDARKTTLAQAEVERLKVEMEQKFKREEEERLRKYEAEKKARSAGASRWEIDPAQIERGKMLGKGAFGEVFRGKLHGKEVAVKVLTKQDIDEETLADFRREVDIMMNLHHPNILLFMGACTRSGHLTIVTELMPRGSVEDIIHSKTQEYPLPFRLGLAKGAALGMNWLHSQKPVFLHLDLKPANLLVDQNWVVKVADFGMSQIKGASSGGIFGSPFYMAPEMLLEKGFDEKVDVYSFGIVLWEIVTRAEPYEGLFKNFDQLADGVGLEKIRPRIPADVHPSLRELITQLWDHDPRRRPSFADVLRTSAIDNVVINISITDHQGRAFWKTNYIDRDTVQPWATFMDGLKAYFHIAQVDPLREKCLRLLLTGQRDGDKVTLKQWNDLLSWFGPLTDNSEKAALGVMERLVWLMNHNWFHGDLTQVEAESLLAKQKRGVIRVKEEGFWLVRFGNPGYFVLSVVASDKGVVHHEIKNQSSVLNAEGKHFQTWDDLINWAKKEWKFSMNAICPGSKYETFLLAAAAQQQPAASGSRKNLVGK